MKTLILCLAVLLAGCAPLPAVNPTGPDMEKVGNCDVYWNRVNGRILYDCQIRRR